MDFRWHHFPALLILVVVTFACPSISLMCKRCVMQECSDGLEKDVQCMPQHTDCATSILRDRIGTLKPNSIFEKYCYAPSKSNKLYRKNEPHCQRNDRANVEVCVCQGDLCNAKLPSCKHRYYGNGRTCERP